MARFVGDSPDFSRDSAIGSRSRVQGIIGRAAKRLLGRNRRPNGDEAPAIVPVAPSPPELDLGRVLARIDWDADPDGLRRGDLQLLPPDVAALIREAARLHAVDELAWAAGLDPVVAVIAILAKAASGSSRSAGRLARNLLHTTDAGAVARAMEQVGLQSLSLTP